MNNKALFSFLFLIAAVRPAAAFDDLKSFMGVDLEEAKRQAEIELYKHYNPAQAEPVDYWPLAVDKACMLKTVAGKMGVTLKPDVAPPEVYLERQTEMTVFQDAMEKNYGQRPEIFHNVYLDNMNIIFLKDDALFYKKGRTAEDSLAHEYVHFVQVKYRGATRDGDMDAYEGEAIRIQEWFRTTYMHWSTPKDPCGSNEPESYDGYHVEDPPRRGHYEVYSPDGWHIEHHFVPHDVKEYSPDGWHIEYH
ncbi:MAG: hypothetical protein ABIJ96_09680 [Elusimicrobiota bacterium]